MHKVSKKGEHSQYLVEWCFSMNLAAEVQKLIILAQAEAMQLRQEPTDRTEEIKELEKVTEKGAHLVCDFKLAMEANTAIIRAMENVGATRLIGPAPRNNLMRSIGNKLNKK